MTHQHMISLSRSSTAILLTATLGLVGCVETLPTTSSQPLTAEEQRMRQQGSAYNKTVVEGAVTGAAIGALSGLLVQRNAQGALVGAAAGAGLGAAAGTYMAQKQKQYANTEQRIDAMIVDVRADNQRISDLIATSKEVIAADKRKIAQLEQQIASGAISKESARRQLASIEANEQYLSKTVANLKKKKGDWQTIATQTRGQSTAVQRKAMAGEISEMEAHISSLERELDTLVERRQITPVA